MAIAYVRGGVPVEIGRSQVVEVRRVVLFAARWERPDDPASEQLSLVLYDARRAPCADRPATVVIGDRTLLGTSDGAGVLRVRIPPGSTAAKVRYTPNDTSTLVELAVALDLPPVSDDGGALRRLENLGYTPAVHLATAVFLFQADFGVVPATGELDAATRARLAAVHDGGD